MAPHNIKYKKKQFSIRTMLQVEPHLWCGSGFRLAVGVRLQHYANKQRHFTAI